MKARVKRKGIITLRAGSHIAHMSYLIPSLSELLDIKSGRRLVLAMIILLSVLVAALTFYATSNAGIGIVPSIVLSILAVMTFVVAFLRLLKKML